jgi:hypothetical protein
MKKSKIKKFLFVVMFSFFLSEQVYSFPPGAGHLPEVPASFCSPMDDRCSAQARAITRSYFSGSMPRAEVDEMLFVGSCYFLNQNYDPAHEHYGYVYLQRKNGRYMFDATFSFYYQTNPYEDMTIEQARARAPADTKQWIVEANNHWRADLEVDPPWQHFLRQNSSGSIDMIGLWGIDAAMTCRLRKARL